MRKAVETGLGTVGKAFDFNPHIDPVPTPNVGMGPMGMPKFAPMGATPQKALDPQRNTSIPSGDAGATDSGATSKASGIPGQGQRKMEGPPNQALAGPGSTTGANNDRLSLTGIAGNADGGATVDFGGGNKGHGTMTGQGSGMDRVIKHMGENDPQYGNLNKDLAPGNEAWKNSAMEMGKKYAAAGRDYDEGYNKIAQIYAPQGQALQGQSRQQPGGGSGTDLGALYKQAMIPIDTNAPLMQMMAQVSQRKQARALLEQGIQAQSGIDQANVTGDWHMKQGQQKGEFDTAKQGMAGDQALQRTAIQEQGRNTRAAPGMEGQRQEQQGKHALEAADMYIAKGLQDPTQAPGLAQFALKDAKGNPTGQYNREALAQGLAREGSNQPKRAASGLGRENQGALTRPDQTAFEVDATRLGTPGREGIFSDDPAIPGSFNPPTMDPNTGRSTDDQDFDLGDLGEAARIWGKPNAASAMEYFNGLSAPERQAALARLPGRKPYAGANPSSRSVQ
jgi:hypothetical protein